MSSEQSKRIWRIAALATMAISLAGCQSFRDAAGISKAAPDEFAVVTKAPLVIPPDYNLRPPRPGAAPTNQTSPTGAAQAALFSDDPNAVQDSLGNGYSSEEKNILATSGAATADHSIRQQLAADSKSMEAADQSFTDEVLFGSGSPDKGRGVNADAEKQRIDAAKSAGDTTPGGGTPPAPDPQTNGSATISKDSSNSGGWLGGIF